MLAPNNVRIAFSLQYAEDSREFHYSPEFHWESILKFYGCQVGVGLARFYRT